MPVWTLSKAVEVDAAHCLPSHSGKCRNLHGHRWKIVVEITTHKLNEQSMVMDFGDISKLARRLDHAYLNELFEFEPTAENIAFWFADNVKMSVDQECQVAATVEETPGSKVTCKIGPDYP